MKKIPILLIPLIFWIISGCESPTGGFDRTNSNDPLSPSFRAGAITGLQVSADTSGVITIRWAESDEIATKNVLEKSLGDSLNFTPIAELTPDIMQFSDTSSEVRKKTYYRISSYFEVADNEDILLGRSTTVLEFGGIVNLANKFLNEENRLQLSWRTDVPFYTHFIISSDKVISENQGNTVVIPAEGIENMFIDPLTDIDFETRSYTITGIIEHDGIEEIIADGAITFDPKIFFTPANVAIEVLNEQDWEISWSNAPFFATNIEVIRLNHETDVIYRLPVTTTSLIDSLLMDNSHDSGVNHFRRYQVRFLTDNETSREIIVSAGIEIPVPSITMPDRRYDDPTSFTLKWEVYGDHSHLIKEFIIERPHPVSTWRFQEIARVKGDIFEYTVTNVNESEVYSFRIRTITSHPSEMATFTYSYSSDYELDYSFNTGMTYVTRMEANADKRYLSVVSFRSGTGNSILITDIVSRQKIADINIPSQQISDFKISPDEEFIYFAVPSDGAIYRADFPTGNNMVKIISDASLGSTGVFRIDVSKDGSFIIGTGGRGFVKRWNLDTYEPVFIYNNPNTPTFYLYKNIAISPDGALIGGNDGRTYIMNAGDGTIEHTLPWASANMTDIQFSADGRYYSYVENFTSTRIFSTENWQLVRSFSSSRRADFHPEKSKIVLLGSNGVITYDFETSRFDQVSNEYGAGPYPGIENAISYIDDDRIATVGGAGTVQIWSKTEKMAWKIFFNLGQ